MRIWILALNLGLIVLVSGGCQTTVVANEESAEDATAGDLAATILDGNVTTVTDGFGDALPLPQDISLDLGTGDSDSGSDECASGGCFGDPCANNDDCFSGLCGKHMGEAVCTKTCQDGELELH